MLNELDSSICIECLKAYNKQYPKDECVIDEGIGDIMIESYNDCLYIPPENETKESFFDRLKRNKEIGENLFYKEWVSIEYPYDCDC